jgi:hypothetical protein
LNPMGEGIAGLGLMPQGFRREGHPSPMLPNASCPCRVGALAPVSLTLKQYTVRGGIINYTPTSDAKRIELKERQ